MQTNQNFKELLEEAKVFYQQIGKVFCPALNADVIFNAEGFHHLRYKGSLVSRGKAEQRNKLSYLVEAVKIIETTTTVQEYREEMQTRATENTNGVRPEIKVNYFGFWAVLNFKSGVRIKCVVRYVEASGQYTFWSVMPFWKEKVTNELRFRSIASKEIGDE